MNRTEAASVVTYLNRAGLVGAMEGQAAVWADALADVSYVTAQTVVRQMVQTRTSDQRWVTPGDVAAAVKEQRKKNLDWIKHIDPPDELASDVARETQWFRAYRRLVGDGLDTEAAEKGACDELGIDVPSRPQIAPRPASLRLPTGRQCAHQPPCIEGHLRSGEGAA